MNLFQNIHKLYLASFFRTGSKVANILSIEWKNKGFYHRGYIPGKGILGKMIWTNSVVPIEPMF